MLNNNNKGSSLQFELILLKLNMYSLYSQVSQSINQSLHYTYAIFLILSVKQTFKSPKEQPVIIKQTYPINHKQGIPLIAKTMQGKIYKNRLTSATSNEHLISENSMILNPAYSHQPTSQKHSLSPLSRFSPQQNQTSPNNCIRNNSISPNNILMNDIFSGNKSLGPNQRTSIMDQYIDQSNNPLATYQPYQQKGNNNMMKRVLSNPNFNSCQFLPGVQDEGDMVQDSSVLNNSVNSNSVFRVPKNIRGTQNINKIGMHDNFRTLNNRNLPATNQQFNYTIAHNNSTPQFVSSQVANIETFPYRNNENSILRQPITSSPSDYITAYQKRHKQRVSALQSQHELEVQFLEDELKTKDELLEDMKRMLQVKEEIIKRLQSQNASLSSRSYINANYNKE